MVGRYMRVWCYTWASRRFIRFRSVHPAFTFGNPGTYCSEIRTTRVLHWGQSIKYLVGGKNMCRAVSFWSVSRFVRWKIQWQSGHCIFLLMRSDGTSISIGIPFLVRMKSSGHPQVNHQIDYLSNTWRRRFSIYTRKKWNSEPRDNRQATRVCQKTGRGSDEVYAAFWRSSLGRFLNAF